MWMNDKVELRFAHLNWVVAQHSGMFSLHYISHQYAVKHHWKMVRMEALALDLSQMFEIVETVTTLQIKMSPCDVSTAHIL